MVESRIEAIRAAKRGEGQSLTQRQALALAGEWYVWYVARHEENPGPVEHWRSMWDALIFHLEEHAPDWVIEEGWRDLEWTREPEVRAGVRPLIADECKTAQFLASKGVVLNTEAQTLVPLRASSWRPSSRSTSRIRMRTPSSAMACAPAS